MLFANRRIAEARELRTKQKSPSMPGGAFIVNRSPKLNSASDHQFRCDASIIRNNLNLVETRFEHVS